MEISKELELEVELADVTKLRYSQDKILMNEELLLMDEQSGFLRWNLPLVNK